MPLSARHAFLACAPVFLCCDPEPNRCGPNHAIVERVIDGDTVVLDSGERVRYLLIDTPEITGDEPECFGENAAKLNSTLVLGQSIDLVYDEVCVDSFDRLLAYVYFEERDIGALLLERGFACVLHIPPNGNDRVEEYEALMSNARSEGRGLWSSCGDNPCR